VAVNGTESVFRLSHSEAMAELVFPSARSSLLGLLAA
jgi:hypothetical protein